MMDHSPKPIPQPGETWEHATEGEVHIIELKDANHYECVHMATGKTKVLHAALINKKLE